MKTDVVNIIVIGLLLMTVSACHTVSENICQLDSAEIYYQKRAPWSWLRFKTIGKDSLIAKGGPMFKITSLDSLKDLSLLMHHYHADSSKHEIYADAVIVALLHHSDITDTLVTNARPEFRMNYNSCRIYDSTMVMYLINAVVSRDAGWREAYDSLYYDNDFHYLSRSGFSQDLPRPIMDGEWFYYE